MAAQGAVHRALVGRLGGAVDNTLAADRAADPAGHVEEIELKLEMRIAECGKSAGRLGGSSLRLP